ncbi:MAG: EpsG family protein, partial [Psychrobacter sp.]|nr:EpsG family protein [Psychrobacter sp.]
MKANRLQLGQSTLYLMIISALSYLVATRDLKVGTDAVNYYQYFWNIDFFHGSQYQHELGFHYLTLLIHKITTDYTVFLFIFSMLINFIYIKSMDNLIDKRNKTLYVLAHTMFIGLFLSSS